MDKDTIIKNLTQKRAKDYTYTVVFFLIFSFFLFFIIRPNITNVFQLQRELKDLSELDMAYEQAIQQIITIQSKLETARNDLPVLDEALPQKPEVGTLVESVRQAATDSSIPVQKLLIDDIVLQQPKTISGLQTLGVHFDTTSSFDQIQGFIDHLENQRRLKRITSISLARDSNVGSGSATLHVQLEIEGYYL
jgi:Tfp pilus assembly protein PilO